MKKIVFCLCPLIVVTACCQGGDCESDPTPVATATPTSTATPTPTFPPEISYDEACDMCEDEAGLDMLGFRMTNISIETAMELCKSDLACD